MRSYFKASLLAYVLLLTPAAAQDTVRVAELDWDGARSVQHILKAVLEGELGLAVEWVRQDPASLLAAMDRGEVDVFPDMWMPDQAEGWGRYIAAGSRQSVLVNDAPYLGTQSLYVPGYVQEEHDIRRVEDLRSPEAARLFDTDGDGRGEIWPGPPGWSARRHQLVKLKSYGLDGLYQPQDLTEEDFKRHVREAYKARQPVVFYFWTPDALHAGHDLRKLEEPPFDGYAMASKKGSDEYNPEGCWSMLSPEEDADWLAKSEIRCATPPSEVYVAHSRSWGERHPTAARFLRQVAFTPDMISGWTLLTVDYDLKPSEVARTWIERNPEVLREWLAEAAE